MKNSSNKTWEQQYIILHLDIQQAPVIDNRYYGKKYHEAVYLRKLKGTAENSLRVKAHFAMREAINDTIFHIQ